MSREESEFKVLQADGTTKIFTLVEFLTVDDMMSLAAKQVAAEIKFGMAYTPVLTEDITDYLVTVGVGGN